jgi:putative spermidine/putrescine transport system ATP-binding protein
MNGTEGVAITIENLRVSYGQTRVLGGVDLQVSPGEFIALLGPSGCGKTTLLRALAGFIPVEDGTITAGGRPLAGLPPERRDMAMMFQSYALWPHMTAAENIGFGLRLRKWSRARIRERVSEMMTLVGLEGLEKRNVTRLSGGQRQRVALARALAIDPPVLLLDEPLSNLDARIRHNMRHELKALQKRLGLTTILVTHDREEAMAMADRIVIIDQGTVAQAGTPEGVYLRPRSEFVASFMGAENALTVDMLVDDGQAVISGSHVSGTCRLPLARTPEDRGVHCVYGGGDVPGKQQVMTARFRSEAASLMPRGEAPAQHLALTGDVTQHSYIGGVYRHSVRVGKHDFLVDHAEKISVGELADVCIPAAALHLFGQSGKSAATGPAGGNARPIPTV